MYKRLGQGARRAVPLPRLAAGRRESAVRASLPAALMAVAVAVLVVFGGQWSAVRAQEGMGTREVEREHFIYIFDNPRYVPMADSVMRIARVRLQELLRDSLDYKPEVYLVDDIEDFSRLIRGRIPDWGAAVAYPPKGRIVIKSPDEFRLGKPLSQLLSHELSHLALAKRTGFYQAPRWFDEGLAQRVSTEWTWFDNLAMSKAAVFGQYIPLQDIEHMNRFNESRVQVAYAQSHVAVNYLFDAYGVNAVNRFLDAVALGKSYDSALIVSTGSTYDEFEMEFQGFWSSRFNLITLLADTMWLWLALALIVVVGAYLKYRKRRQYFRKWEEEERYQSTDFDYGDPDRPEQTDDDEPWRS